MGRSFRGATPDEIAWLHTEKSRMLAAGAWEIGQCDKWVSKAFLVPKKTTDGSKNYRLVCDLRPINSKSKKSSQ